MLSAPPAGEIPIGMRGIDAFFIDHQVQQDGNERVSPSAVRIGRCQVSTTACIIPIIMRMFAS